MARSGARFVVAEDEESAEVPLVDLTPRSTAGREMQRAPREGDSDELDQVVNFVANQMGPVVERATIGAVTGACVGYATKKAAKTVMLVAGVGIVALQLLANRGYVDVHWNTIGEDARRALDQNGDGRVDREDIKIITRRAIGVLGHRVPDAAGFGAGFLFGFLQG